MIESIKKLVKWNNYPKSSESKKNQTSILLAAFIELLEDILFWKKMWLSLSCILVINVTFFLCIYQQINLLIFIFGICAVIISIDAFETWLKYKHRTSFLKKIVKGDRSELKSAAVRIKSWLKIKWAEFVYLRETNHTKAFLLINIILATIFLIGNYTNGYLLMYLVCMCLCISHKLIQPLKKYVKKIQQNTESDSELEGLIPEVSEVDIKLLSIEPEQQTLDDRYSLDYWKPEDVPIEEASDSSNSSSLVTNLSMEKMHTLEKDVETSDSSEDEYIPLVQQERLQSTLQVVQPTSTWGSSAYNAFFNLTETVANMMFIAPKETKRKRVSSIDSSDGFEIINENDLN